MDFIKNKDYMLDLCVRMAHHSTALEGNTLSLNDTASILLDNYINKAMNEREYSIYKEHNNINIKYITFQKALYTPSLIPIADLPTIRSYSFSSLKHS